MARPFDPAALRRLNAPLRAGRGLTQPSTALMPHEPALDGLRLIALVMVVAHHLHLLGIGPAWFDGGFVGIEVFFVITGYLTTVRLLEEWSRDGRIAIGEFFVRRFRRLLPPVVLAIVAIGAFASIFRSSLLAELRGDVLPSVLSLSNWADVFDGVGHFARRTDPPLLAHLWRIAVEGQWLLVWPAVLYGLLNWRRGELRQVRLVVATLMTISALSVPFMFREFDTFRTDFAHLATTGRAAGLLLGAVLATMWTPWRWHGAGRRRLPLLDAAAVLALIALVVLVVRSHSTTPGAYELKLFVVTGPAVLPGGLFAGSVLAAVMVAAAVHPAAALVQRSLGWPPLAMVGRRAVLAYLWHWPVLVLFRAGESPLRLVAAAVVTALLTEGSYRVAVLVFERGVVSAWFDAGRRSTGTVRRDHTVSTVLYAMAALCVVGAVVVRLVNAESINLERDASIVEFDATAVLKSPQAPSVTVASAPSTTSPTLPRALLVVGDAQAHSLVLNRPSGIEGTFRLTDGSRPGCGVFDSGSLVTARRGFRHSYEECDGWVRDWSDAARATKPAVTLVALGAWDVFDITDDGTTLTFASPEFDQRFLAELDQGIEVLKSAGSRVALMEIPCMRPIDVAEADVVALPERGDDARVTHLNTLLQRAAADDPAFVSFVGGAPQWCADPAIAADRSYRWNGIEFYKAGAKLQFETIAATLVRIPV